MGMLPNNLSLTFAAGCLGGSGQQPGSVAVCHSGNHRGLRSALIHQPDPVLALSSHSLGRFMGISLSPPV